MFTDYGKKLLMEVINEYPNLYEYYSPTMGNFQFTKTEMRVYLDDIIEFIIKHSDYKIVMQNDGLNDWFYLTNIDE